MRAVHNCNSWYIELKSRCVQCSFLWETKITEIAIYTVNALYCMVQRIIMSRKTLYGKAYFPANVSVLLSVESEHWVIKWEIVIYSNKVL